MVNPRLLLHCRPQEPDDLGSNPGAMMGSQCGFRKVLDLSVPLPPHLLNGGDLGSASMIGAHVQ